LAVYGTGFVPGSVVQWNGQDLSTNFNGGETSNKDRLLVASVPGSLLANPGIAIITVYNPPPGGGISNSFNEDDSSAPPLVSYPASINFGQVLVNVTATQTLQLTNLGYANYTINSVTINSASLSAQANSCVAVSIYNNCNLQVQFSPTIAGTENAILKITDNTPNSPHSIPVTGAGTRRLFPWLLSRQLIL
jgi:hypothetical protein